MAHNLVSRVVIYLCITSSIAQAGRPSFLVQGTVTRTVHSYEQEQSASESFRFTFRVNGTSWLVRTEPIDPLHLYEFFLTGSDSTNVYQLHTPKRIVAGYDPTNLPPRFRASLAPEVLQRIKSGYTNGSNSCIAYIYDGNIPEYGQSPAAPLWLAFGSAQFFTLPRAKAAAPCVWQWVYLPGQRAIYPVILNASVDLGTGVWAIPAHIVFGAPVTEGHNGPTDKTTLARNESRFTTADYTVSSSTNFGDLWLPLEFKLRRFFTTGGTSDGKEVVLEEFVATVKQVETNVGQALMMPAPEIGATVSDHRTLVCAAMAGSRQSFEYRAEERRWKSVSEVTNTDKYIGQVKAVASAAASQASRAHRRVVVLSVLVTVAIVFALTPWLLRGANCA